MGVAKSGQRLKSLTSGI